MLSEVKKNPRVSAKDLQKSLDHVNISGDEATIGKTRMVLMGRHHGRSHCCPKKV